MRKSRRRVALLFSLLATVLALAVPAPVPAAGNETWTWSSATHPAGSASMRFWPDGGTSGAGLWLYQGMYYVPGVAHVDKPLGAWKEETAPSGQGGLGHVSHSTYGTGGLDIGLIATGTRPIEPRIRVSDGWQDAPVSAVGHPGDLRQGMQVCHSGFSDATQAAGSSRCGTLVSDCLATSTTCQVTNPSGLISGGDSGGAVWWYDGKGGVVLEGWVSAGSGTQVNGSWPTMHFIPPWVLQNHQWTAAETWQGESGVSPFPSGQQRTGCFVTTAGCVRS